MVKKELKRDFIIVLENGFFLVKRIHKNRERVFSKSATKCAAIGFLVDFTGFTEQTIISELS